MFTKWICHRFSKHESIVREMIPISIYAINVGSCICQHFPQNVGIGAVHIFFIVVMCCFKLLLVRFTYLPWLISLWWNNYENNLARGAGVVVERGTSRPRHHHLAPGPWFNIKMSSYQYRKSHCGDKTVVRSSYLHDGISYTGKMTSFYWISHQIAIT